MQIFNQRFMTQYYEFLKNLALSYGLSTIQMHYKIYEQIYNKYISVILLQNSCMNYNTFVEVALKQIRTEGQLEASNQLDLLFFNKCQLDFKRYKQVFADQIQLKNPSKSHNYIITNIHFMKISSTTVQKTDKYILKSTTFSNEIKFILKTFEDQNTDHVYEGYIKSLNSQDTLSRSFSSLGDIVQYMKNSNNVDINTDKMSITILARFKQIESQRKIKLAQILMTPVRLNIKQQVIQIMDNIQSNNKEYNQNQIKKYLRVITKGLYQLLQRSEQLPVEEINKQNNLLYGNNQMIQQYFQQNRQNDNQYQSQKSKSNQNNEENESIIDQLRRSSRNMQLKMIKINNMDRQMQIFQKDSQFLSIKQDLDKCRKELQKFTQQRLKTEGIQQKFCYKLDKVENTLNNFMNEVKIQINNMHIQLAQLQGTKITKKSMIGEQFVNKNCLAYKNGQIQIQQNRIISKRQRCRIHGRQIPYNAKITKIFRFDNNQDSEFNENLAVIGVVEDKYKDQNSRKNWIGLYSNGQYNQCGFISQEISKGFKVDELVQVTVDRQAGTIQYRVNAQLRQRLQSQRLRNIDSKWIFMIYILGKYGSFSIIE